VANPSHDIKACSSKHTFSIISLLSLTLAAQSTVQTVYSTDSLQYRQSTVRIVYSTDSLQYGHSTVQTVYSTESLQYRQSSPFPGLLASVKSHLELE